MIPSFVAIFAYVAQLLWGATLLVAAIYACRRLRLPTVPWVVGYYVLGFLLGIPMSWVVRDMLDSASLPTVHGNTGAFLQTMSYLSLFLETLGSCLVTLLLMSDFAFVLANSSFSENLAVPKFVANARNHAVVIGCILIISLLIMPIFWGAMWLS